MHMMVVTAGIILRGDTVLIAQRKKNDTMGGLWEFPGGGVDDGETPDDCIRRELMEELGIDTRPYALYDAMTASHGRLVILFYLCEIVQGEPHGMENQHFTWCPLKDLSQYPFTPTDMFVADRLARERQG